MMKNNFEVHSTSRMCLYMMILSNDSESTSTPHPPEEPDRSDTDPNRHSDPIEPPIDPSDDEIQEPDIPEMPQREPLDPDEKNPLTETDYLNNPDDIDTEENGNDFDETEGVTN